MKYLLLLFYLFFAALIQAQETGEVNTPIRISKSELSDLNSKIALHNQLELLSNIEQKLEFLTDYENKAIEGNHSSHLLFTQFLKGETLFWGENLPGASKSYHSLLKISKTNEDVDNEFLAYTSLMHFHLKTQREDSVNFYMAKAKALLNGTTSGYYKVIYLRRMSQYYIEKEDYNSALNRLLYINTLELKDRSVIHCNALTNIGWIYEHLSYPERAKIYYQKALKVAKEIKSNRHLNFCKLKLAHIELFNLNNPTQALDAYKQLEDYYQNSNEYKEGVLYGTMGYAYLLADKQEKAFHYLKKSRDFFEDSKDSVFLCLPYTYLTHYYNKLEQYDNSVQSGETALQIIANKKLFKARKLILLDKLAESYMAIGNKEKAYDLLKELNEIKTTLEAKKNNIAFIETQQENLANQEKLEIVELKNQILNKNKTQYLTSLFLVGAILALTLFLYFNRQKTNKKLREIDALKTDFFTQISHEFRTPLTLISSPIQEYLDESSISEEKRKHFEIAQQNTLKLSSLVDQLLELSKIDSGNRKLLLEKSKPTQLISAWSESFSYLAEQKRINFSTDFDNKEVEAWFDKEALENIVVNLLGNAVKYTSPKGKIVARASVQNKVLSMEVNNTGQGLTKAQIKTVFNRFYQTDGYNEGVGVGLSLVKELVELHRGSIVVNSDPDGWTEFKVSLCLDRAKLKNYTIKENSRTEPKSSAHNENRLKTSETSPKTGELPIMLIVEDNTDVSLLLSDTFKEEYQIIQAKNGEQGIQMAIEQVPDIILSDLMMPVKDGIVLTRTLKEDERSSHIPIILLTAKAGDKHELTGIKVGADDYITKPFNHKILKSKVASMISLRKKLRSRYSQEVILRPKDIAISSVDEQFLEKVQTVLDDKLVESTFTVEQFSKAVNMSRMQLHRKLKALTGLSASEFIRSQRLKLAAKILKSSDINVSEVGFRVGFNDHAYFSKCFKEAYNSTPSDFAAGP